MTSVGERTASTTREVPLEPGGEVDVMTTATDIRIVGHDEAVVRITVPAGEDVDETVAVERDGSVLRIRAGAAMAFQLGPLTLSAHRGADEVEVAVPRHAALAVRTVSGAVAAAGHGGESRWATASGDLRLRLDGDRVTVESMSGDVDLQAGAALSARLRTVSGDLTARAPRWLRLAAATTSGDLRLEGDLEPGGDHEITTVSGDVELATGSAIRLETQSLTGDVRAAVTHRTEGSRGRRVVVVGSGSIPVRVRTMSGDIALRAAGGGASPSPEASGPDVDPVSGAPRPAETPVPPPVPPAPPAPTFVVAEAEAAPNLVRPNPAADLRPDPAPASVAEPAAAPFAPVAGSASFTDRREEARLEVLRALERGELDVETASRRIEALEDAGPRAFRGWV